MIKLFFEITEADRDLIGGKAYNQARLWQAKFNVPPGVIITSSAFHTALNDHQLKTKLASLTQSSDNIDQIFQELSSLKLSESLTKELSAKLAQAFPDNYPDGFAVRSSALGEDSSAHSFAGIHRTLLGVARDQIATAIVACWASALAPTAIDYRRERGLNLTSISVAVLIQPLLMPRVAGVAFTIDPITGNQREIVINATYGLGELLVSGQVEPDIYRLEKGTPLTISARQLGAKAEQLIRQGDELTRIPVAVELRERSALTDAEILALGEQLQRIEAFYGKPQDVEWVFDQHALFIVQSRPVTASVADPTRDLVWSRANFREIVPDLPSPFCSGIMAMSEPDFALYYAKAGMSVEHLRPTLKFIYGRPYFNITLMRFSCEKLGLPVDTMLRMLGHGAELESKMDYRINYRKLLTNLPIVFRSLYRQWKYVPTIDQATNQANREIARIKKLDPSQMTYAEIQAGIGDLRPYFLDFLFTSVSIASAIMGKLFSLLQKLDAYIPEPENFINVQIAAGKKNVSAQQGFDLSACGETARKEERCRQYFTPGRIRFDDYHEQLAGTEFLAQFQLFIQRYGHRAIYESDSAQPRFYEDQTYLLASIGNIVNAKKFTPLAELNAQQEAQATREWQLLTEKIRASAILASFKLALIRRELTKLKQLFTLRERVRSEAMRTMAAHREFALHLAMRLVKEGYLATRDDFFYLDAQDIITHFANNTLSALARIVEQRKARYQFYRTLDMPNLLHESEIPFILKRLREEQPALDRFKGLAVSPGVIEGEVVVLKNPSEFAKMQPGKILVAPATDPAWTPLFAVAIGVIVEMGGILSHGSIVAREYGLPTVVNIPGITKRLKDGDRVIVDGTNGVVELIKAAAKNDQAAD